MSTRHRSTRRLGVVVSDDDDEEQDHQSQTQSTTLSSPPETYTHRGRSKTHTLDGDSDFEAERDDASPELELSPQPSSSNTLKRNTGKKGHSGPPKKNKRLRQSANSDEDYHDVPAPKDEESILPTKRQSKPTAKAKANKGKGKVFTTGARDERKTRQSQPSATEVKTNPVSSTKRRREPSKAGDDLDIDIVGEADAVSSLRSPSPPPAKEATPPPPKRRKYPTIPKNKGAQPSSETASKVGSTSVKPSTPQIPGPPKPSAAGSRVPPLMVGTSDFDLRDAKVYNDLFAKPGGSSSGQALQKKNEERHKEIGKMKDEARAKRMAEMTQSFDLQAQFEKIRRFEETLVTGSKCMYPNFLAVKWRDIWEIERRRAAMEQALSEESQKEEGLKEEGEVLGHSGR